MDSVNIGSRIKEFRQSLNLKQKEFADIVGISNGALSEVENGKRFPPFESYISICEILFKHNKTTDWLLTGVGGSHPLVESSTPTELSETEEMLLNAYRSANDKTKRKMLKNVLNLEEQSVDADK